jgi:superfamily II RNA helicase
MAYAARSDLDQDILVIDIWNFELFDPQWLAGFVKHSSFHNDSHLITECFMSLRSAAEMKLPSP